MSREEERIMRRHSWLVLSPTILTVLVIVSSTESRLSAADDIMQKARAMYVALRSYVDTGVVLYESGSSKDRHTFTTLLNRSPRRFVLDFVKAGGDRYVVWGDPDAFHTWWKTTGQQFDYPNPDNTPALSQSGAHNYGVGNKIPTLLYGRAPLLSDFANFTDLEIEGTEDIGNRHCHRLSGTTRDVYAATGREVNVRKMTVWIDVESLLIRRVVEQWKTTLPGDIKRITTTYEPQANPTIDEKRLRFTPPEPR
jgi:outer membrane lipoprotein-sorting protein